MADVGSDNGNEYASRIGKLPRGLAAIDSKPAVSSGRGASERASARSKRQPGLTSLEIGSAAGTLREQVIWNLREEGYRDREIAELLGITKQRVSQIEHQLILRARGAKSKWENSPDGPAEIVRWKVERPVRTVTIDEFERRLDAVNGYYEPQLQRILKRGYNRQKICARAKNPLATLFWKVWPLIETYELERFSYSRLIDDFPSLAEHPHLPQLLSRLRKKGLLRSVGSVRIEGQNPPEVLMAQTPIEQYMAPEIEKLVVKWIGKLEHLKSTYRANRIDCSMQSIRSQLIETLIEEGQSIREIEDVFRAKLNRTPEGYQRMERDSEHAPAPFDNY